MFDNFLYLTMGIGLWFIIIVGVLMVWIGLPVIAYFGIRDLIVQAKRRRKRGKESK